MKTTVGITSVDQYIASQPKPAQRVLTRSRNIIRKAVQTADDVISYRIPVYKLKGKPVLYFAGWSEHYSLYPSSVKLVAAFKEELAPYDFFFQAEDGIRDKLVTGVQTCALPI